MTILADAAEVLAQRGHTRDELLSPDGKVCVIGAILVATGLEAYACGTNGVVFDDKYAQRAHEVAQAVETLRRSLVARGLVADDLISPRLGSGMVWNGPAVVEWNNTVADQEDAVLALKFADEYAATHEVEVLYR